MTFLLKWKISEEKTRDICLNVGFSEIKQLIFDEMEDFRREKTRDLLKWEISEEKIHDFCLNGGFPKIKRTIFA